MGFGAVVPAGGAGGIAIGAWIAKANSGSLRWFMERSAVLFLLTSAINAMTLALVGLLTGVGVWTVPHPLLLGLVPAAIAVASVLAFLAVPSAAARLEATGDQRRGGRWLQTTARIVRDTERELRESRWRLLGADGIPVVRHRRAVGVLSCVRRHPVAGGAGGLGVPDVKFRAAPGWGRPRRLSPTGKSRWCCRALVRRCSWAPRGCCPRSCSGCWR
jgi:hypothetical protein